MSRRPGWLPNFGLRKVSPVRRPRLQVGVLEDRVTPATFTINSLSDAVLADGNLTLREAIASMNLGNNSGLSAAEKLLVTGTYGVSDTMNITPAGTITMAGVEYAVNKAVAINGHTSGTTINAGGGRRIFNTQGAPASTIMSFDRLTLTSGFSGAAADGGAVLAQDEILLFTDSTITASSANAEGGGFYFAANGRLTLTRSIVTGNTANTDGGGVYFFQDGSVNIVNSSITNNKATGTGAGMYFFGAVGVGNFNVISSTISGNSGGGEGGGLFLTSITGTINVTNSTLAANTALNGGGIRVNSGTLNVTNSTVHNNFANGPSGTGNGLGGGLFNLGTAAVTISNSTLSNNKANGSGGGIFSASPLTLRNATLTGNTARADGGATGSGGGLGGASGTNTLHNTIVAGNIFLSGATPSDLQGSGATGGSTNNLIGDAATAVGLTHGVNGNIVGNAGVGTIVTNTVLNTTLANNGGFTFTHALVTGGPAVNTGNNAQIGGATTDQRGAAFFLRNSNSTVDIGAYEVQPISLTVDSTADTVDNDFTAGKFTLREAVGQANFNPGADTITFSSLFNSPQTITLGGSEISFTDPLTVTGKGASLTTISGGSASRIFNGNNLTLSNVTLTAGITTGAGGAAVLNGGSLTDCVITGNTATNFGGGLYGTGLTITRCTFSNNTTSSDGGGVYVYEAVTILDSLFLNNKATVASGGAIGTDGNSTATIRGSTFTGNSAASGAGVIALGNAGFSFNGTLNLQNCTITGNSATSGAAVQLGGASTGTIDVDGTIISGNTVTVGDIGSSKTVNVNFSAIGTASGFTLSGTSGNNRPFGESLKLRALANNGGPTQTFAFETDSPLRNNGNNLGGLTTDQRGFPRNDGGGVDIGAFELNTLVTNTNDSGTGSLRNAVAESNRVVGADTITFDAGLVSGQTVTLTSGQMTLSEAVTIAGPGAALLSISGDNVSRIFDVTPAPAASAINLTKLSLIKGSTTDQGGAIFASNEILTITDCVLDGNKANQGGAIRQTGGGSLLIERSTLSNNSALTYGGAINVLGSTATLLNSTFSGNTAAFEGGGVYFSGLQPVTIRNCTISDNSSKQGGGVQFYQYTGANVIQNSTITDNTAGSNGGGINQTTNLANVNLESTIVSGNSSPIGADIRVTGGVVNATKSAIGIASGFTFGSGSGNLAPGTDLKLGALASNGGPTQTHMPAIDSPLRGQGSNPAALTTDQRGFARTDGVGNVDIGAVQVFTNKINVLTWGLASQKISGPNFAFVLNADPAIDGYNAGNFQLTGPGAVGAAITTIFDSGPTVLITGTIGAEGELGITMVNDHGLNYRLTNLPFVGTPNLVDAVPLSTLSIVVNDATLTDAEIGFGKFTITSTYSEAMDPATGPVFDFPTVGENPAGSIVFSSGAFISPTQYRATFNVNDLNISLSNIDVRANFGKDTVGNSIPFFLQPNLFSIDTRNPFAVSILRNDANPTKAATVNWTVNFSEAVTGLTKDNFSLFNGGLTGSPAIIALSGGGATYTVTASTGSGEGNLALVVDNGAGVTEANGNFMANTPISGGAYDVDHISPAASMLTLNTLVVSDVNVGPNGFTATLKYNELMNQAVNPTVSFPAEFPASLTFNGGVWLDARTFQAKFNVADLGVTQADIDIRFSGAEDIVGNVQAQFDAADVFDIDTQNAVIASITSASANGTYTTGQTVDVTLNFSEPLDLIGALNVTLDTGAVVSIIGPASGASLSGTYTVGAGESSADLNVIAIALTGGSTLKDAATNNAVLALPGSNLANNAAIVISTGGGATVTGFVVNNTDTQRSRITTIQVNFSAAVNAATLAAVGGITLTRTIAAPGGIVGTVVDASNGLIVTPSAGSVTSVTLTFDSVSNDGIDFASLADGYWRLAVPSLSYQSTLNDVALRRLFGDFDNNGTVEGAVDFPAFGNAFNQTGPNSPFDFNNDGIVDGAIDFPAFGARFNLTL